MRLVQRAWKQAEEILANHNVHRAPVNVRAIASEYAKVVEQPLDAEVSGALVPLGSGKWMILVNDTHPEVRRRFTIAHELGHLLLHGFTAPHADRAFRFRDARSSEGSALEEIQANQFAAELLMPRELVLKATRMHPLDHATGDGASDEALHVLVADLSEKFGVSKQAMTIRVSSLFA